MRATILPGGRLGKRGHMKVLLMILSGITLTGLLVLYAGQGDKLRMHDDPKAMKEEILKKVPIGSRIEDAKKIMEANGFGCQLEHNQFYSVQREDDPTKDDTHERADFLYCGKSKTTWPPVIREW